MNENMTNNGASKRRKTLSATLAVVMVLTMLLSGTLAYFYQSNALNTIQGRQLEKLAIAHDDFDPETGNKDIYVENAGESTLYVRVRLTEDYKDNYDYENNQYLAEGSDLTYKPGYEQVEGDPKHGMMIHRYSSLSAEEGIETGGTAADQDFHENYFAWKFGGGTNGKTYLRGTVTSEASGEDFYSTDATSDRYIKGNVAYDVKNDGDLYPAVTEENKNVYGTTSACDGVIGGMWWSSGKRDAAENLTERLAVATWKKNYRGWIYGGDGWAYWSQPLKPGEATGLLLDQVSKVGKIADDQFEYEYNIHVDFEAVDDTDVGLWLGEKLNSSSGDEWTSANTVADFWGIRILQALINYNHVDIDGWVNTINDIQNNECTFVVNNSDGSSETVTCEEVKTLLELVKIELVEGILTQEEVEKKVNDAKTMLEEYKTAKQANADDPVNHPDPDAVVLTKSALAEAPSAYVMGDDDLSNYLVNTYGNATTGTLTAMQAKAMTTIKLRGASAPSGEEATKNYKKVKDISYINKTYFPNLTTIDLAFCLLQPEGTETEQKRKSFLGNLPVDLEVLTWQVVRGDYLSIDISNLNLKELSLNASHVDHLSKTSGEVKGLYGLYSDSVMANMEELDIRPIRTFLDSSGTVSRTIKLSDFPNLYELMPCSGNVITAIDFSNQNSLKAFVFDGCSGITELDISPCGSFVSLSTSGIRNIKKVICRNDQSISHHASSANDLAVYVKDDPAKKYFYKIAKGSSTRVEDPDAATNWPEEYAFLFPGS